MFSKDFFGHLIVTLFSQFAITAEFRIMDKI